MALREANSAEGADSVTRRAAIDAGGALAPFWHKAKILRCIAGKWQVSLGRRKQRWFYGVSVGRVLSGYF